ncbi:MAG: hypothetical protein K5778_06555 [Bacteroidaceae bacterium]|nr:hypothetical protein [Bacteroidaceae bacterium]
MDKENVEKSKLYQYRGVQKCLSEGISFLTNHFLRFVRLTLPVSLPFALVVAALIYLACDVTVVTDGTVLTAVAGGLSGLCVVLTVFYVALIYRLLQLNDEGYDMNRLTFRRLYTQALWPLFFKALGVTLLITLIEAVFCYAFQYIWQLTPDDELISFASIVVGLVVLSLVALAVLTPLTLCTPGALLGQEGFFRDISTAYRWGWRRWGKVFSLNLLVGLIVWIVSTLLFSPAIVVGLMQRNATMSMMQGDAVDLPGGFGFWVAVILFVSAFIYTLLLWLQHVPVAYQYASAKVSDEEEHGQKKPMI